MLQIGDKLPEFSLIGYDNEVHSNFEYADKYALAVVFTSDSSPIAKAYGKRMMKLFTRYEDDNLAIIAINSNCSIKSPEDSLVEMKKTAERLNMEELHFMYLKDEDQSVAKMFGATCTPEVFLFNSKRELVYKGAIDDYWESENGVTSAYLEEAIEEALDGMDIDFPEIPSDGTPIIWK
ncbi:MAG: thioredoxin family protein [Bacteroidia bacterium]|nr:thioredoxin family protein [Bacteroidia bacterium]MBP9688676.1 thioredoxin family protein [Bacteroidia bacterium]